MGAQRPSAAVHDEIAKLSKKLFGSKTRSSQATFKQVPVAKLLLFRVQSFLQICLNSRL
jgi:hypothetical protein